MKKIVLYVLLSVLLVYSLSACNLSASSGPQVTATTEGSMPFPLPTGGAGAVNAIDAALTQTAIAKSGPGNTPIVLPTQSPLDAPTAVVEPVATLAPVPTEPPAAPAVSWQPTPGLPATYTLQRGEHPYCIARRFNIDPATLLNANGLNANSKPAQGTVLTIPAGAAAWNSGSRSLITHPATYTVAGDETVYGIACKYGDVDPNGIIAVNGLQSPYTLSAGQTLQIP